LAIELDDHLGMARGYGALGCVFSCWQAEEMALLCHMKSLELAREVGMRRDVARALANLANAALQAGTEMSQVEDMQRTALEAYTALVEENEKAKHRSGYVEVPHDRIMQGRVYGNLGQAMEGQGGKRVPDAGYMYEMAREIAEQAGDRMGVMRAHLLLGKFHVKMGEEVSGATYASSGLKQAEELGDLPAQIQAHVLHAQILEKSGYLKRTLEAYSKARGVALTLGDMGTEAWMSYEMAALFEKFAAETSPLAVSVIPEKEKFMSCYLRNWLDYTSPEFIDVLEEMRCSDDSDNAAEVAALAKCLKWVVDHTPGATKLDHEREF